MTARLYQMQNLQIQTGNIGDNSNKEEKSIQIIFLIHGISSLLGWFVVMNSLEYFHFLYPIYDVYEFFLLLILLGFLVAIIVYKKLTTIFTYQRKVGLGSIVSSISLICILLSSVIFESIKPLGFTFALISCFMLGFSTNIAQLSYFAVLNFLPQKAITRFNVGTAISGLLLTILRMIILAASGTKPHFIPILIYFSIALIVQIINIFLNNRFINTKYYIQKVKPIQSNRSIQERLSKNKDEIQVQIQVGDQKNLFKQLKQVNKIIYPYPIIICANFIITMMLYPDLTVKIQFDFSPSWSSLIFIFLFSLGDTIGKILVQFNKTFNKQSNIFLIISRLIFYIIIPAMATKNQLEDYLLHNNVFPFIVLFIFGVSNGLVLSSSVILVFQKCPLEYKQMAGLLSGISLQIGLTLGIIFGLPMQLIVK